jgi:hypothetical protein
MVFPFNFWNSFKKKRQQYPRFTWATCYLNPKTKKRRRSFKDFFWFLWREMLGGIEKNMGRRARPASPFGVLDFGVLA